MLPPGELHRLTRFQYIKKLKCCKISFVNLASRLAVTTKSWLEIDGQGSLLVYYIQRSDEARLAGIHQLNRSLVELIASTIKPGSRGFFILEGESESELYLR